MSQLEVIRSFYHFLSDKNHLIGHDQRMEAGAGGAAWALQASDFLLQIYIQKWINTEVLNIVLRCIIFQIWHSERVIFPFYTPLRETNCMGNLSR